MHRQKFRGGLLRMRVADGCQLQDFLELIADQAEAPTRLEQRELFGTTVVVKTEDLRGKARLRYALRRTGREREFDNLRWLQERGFRVVPPLAAGALLRSGLPARQWLVTGFLAGEVQLDRFAQESTATELRSRRFDALAREVARMHALGFVHRDLYPRNLLVSGGDANEHRPTFLDAWRGGPGFSLRGPSWDLGCLMSEADSFWLGAERGQFLEAYFEERSSLGKPVREAAFRRSMNSAIEAQRERAQRRGKRREKRQWRARQDSNLGPSD